MKGIMKTLTVIALFSVVLIPLALYQPITASESDEPSNEARGFAPFRKKPFDAGEWNTMMPEALEGDEDGADPIRERVHEWIRDRRLGLRLLLKLLRNGEPVEYSGYVVGFVKHILILDLPDDGQVRVILPPLWSDSDEVINVNELLEILGTEDPITVKALRGNIREDGELQVFVLFGYEIGSDAGNFYAVLPFNIE